MGEAALRAGVRKRSGRPVPVARRALLPGDWAIPGYEIAGVLPRRADLPPGAAITGFCYHDEATLLIALSIEPAKHQIETVDYILKPMFIPLHPLSQEIGLPFKYGDPRHDEVPAFVVRTGFVDVQDIHS